MTDTITADELEHAAERLTSHREGRRNRYLRAAFTIRAMEADAKVGALVRQIREHPMGGKTATCVCVNRLPIAPSLLRDYFDLHEESLTSCLAHLDSLVPKAKVAPSGITYEWENGYLRAHTPLDAAKYVLNVPDGDWEFLAALLAEAK